MRVLFCTLLASAWLTLRATAQPANDRYQFSVDLTQVQNDRLTVRLVPPALPTDREQVYCLPKIVPGTYSIYDFGRFVHDFKATDPTGQPLPVERLDDNRWRFAPGSQIAQISYQVEDTYDTQLDNFVFEPCGTNIQADTNFVLNGHGFFGYFEGHRRLDYELTFTKPAGFYGSTPLRPVSSTPTQDRFLLPNYDRLVDSPIMYNRPDTTLMQVGGAEVLVSVYSPGGKLGSKFVADNIRDILNAQKNYLGGKLPVDRYAFIIYLFNGFGGSGMMGALEHSYSSVYFLPEMEPENIAQFIRDVAAHEFFHIVTPLSIHSEEIQFFDFNQPKMSKHLWLYEGVIEYFAGHVQVKEGLTSFDSYLNVLRSKIMEARSYNDTVPFTVMSRGCLGPYKEQYGNVYAKGALIGLCLDVKLRQLSAGRYGVQDLMADLARTYGPQKPFKDEELFDKIASLTYPEVRQFFARYVEGPEPLPLAETFALVGLDLEQQTPVDTLSFGHIYPTVDEQTDTTVVIIGDIELEAGQEKLDYQIGDKIVTIDKQKVTASNFTYFVQQLLASKPVGSTVPMQVLRRDARTNREKLRKVKVKIVRQQYVNTQLLAQPPNPTAAQLELRRAWLGR